MAYYNQPPNTDYDDLPDLLPYEPPNNSPYGEPVDMAYPRSMFMGDMFPSPPRHRDTPSSSYSSATLSSSPYNESTQEPAQESTHTPTGPSTSSPGHYSSSGRTYSAPSSPGMPDLEDVPGAQYQPFSEGEDTEAEDTEYTPSQSERVEPGLEYDTSCVCSEDEEGEDEDDEDDEEDEDDDEEDDEDDTEDEMSTRGRPTKRAGTKGRHARDDSTSTVLARSLKESLVALRVQELKKVAHDNEKTRSPPLWKTISKQFLILLLLFAAAFTTVWVVNEVHYRGGLPYIKLFRG
ncbi:hypothetical protein V501_05411 [Pseudogymnoascus sp. VKM F-4519 (FW-2642)]|nr:hypothetical protein V501_05411 [Pseudogymnoascus sp. VKM F-4519 (FW-2642)]